MPPGVFITGTDTGVGKTVIAAALTRVLQRWGVKATYFKPVQTGGIRRGNRLVSPDLAFVRTITGQKEDERLLNPVCLEPPLAPGVAAEISGEFFDVGQIVEAYHRLAEVFEFVVAEGIGGLCVPVVGTQVFVTDLIRLLRLPLIVVAKPGLGSINHTVLTVKIAESEGIRVLGIIMNFCRKPEGSLAEETNPKVISAVTRRPILGTIPYVGDLAGPGGRARLVESVAWHLDLEKTLKQGGCRP